MEHWYTLYTKPNAEYQVATALCKRGIEIFLPEVASPHPRHKGRKRPLFPCYLFIKVDFEKGGLLSVRWTPGLRHVLAFDNRPMPLPDRVIKLIQRQVERLNTAGGWTAHAFQPGEKVQITGGPLQGLLAIFEGPTKPSERVRVLLDFLGQARRATVSVADLEKTSSFNEFRTPHKIQSLAPRRSRRTRGQGRRINSG